jgi:hypothetical protein
VSTKEADLLNIIWLKPIVTNQKRAKNGATNGFDAVGRALNVAQLRTSGAHNQDCAPAKWCRRAGCLAYA